MIFILATALLVVGILFYQSLLGAFSTLIMCVLTILSATVAFNYYEVLANAYLLDRMPNHAHAVSLMAIFILLLLLLRVAADNLIRGNVVMPLYIDKPLSIVFGFITAMIMVGVLSIGVQMLPFDPKLMMFERYDDAMNTRNRMFPFADEFTAGMISGMSATGMSGKNSFGMVHDDLIKEIHCHKVAASRTDIKGLKGDPFMIRAAWYPEDTSLEPGENEKVLAMRVSFNQDAQGAGDKIQFTPSQIRVVDANSGKSSYMAARHNLIGPGFQALAPVEVISVAIGQPYDLVFYVDNDFEPWFIEFKRGARTSILPSAFVEETPGSLFGGPKSPKDKDTTGTKARAGWTGQKDLTTAQFTADLPFTFVYGSANATFQKGRSNADLVQRKLESGIVAGNIGTKESTALDELDRGLGRFKIEQFAVPEDKRLLRLDFQVEPAQVSLLGNIFFSVQSIASEYVLDAQKRKHRPVGKYVMVPIPNKPDAYKVELIYRPNVVDQQAGRLDQFKYISKQDLRQQGTQVGYIFLVEPGTTVVQFEGGGKPFEAVDLGGKVAR